MTSIYQNRAGFHVKFPKWGQSLLWLTTSCEIDTGQGVSEKEHLLGAALRKEGMKGMTTLFPDVFYILIKFL